MDNRTLGIIGGVALFIALLSPFFIENSKKVEKLYKEAVTFHQNKKYMYAVDKYTAVLNESKKLGNTAEGIDTDFPSLPISIITNYRIASCYYEYGNELNDPDQYSKAKIYIDKSIDKTTDDKLHLNLKYLQAMILYRMGKFDIAKVRLIEIEDNYSNIDPDAQWVSEVIFTIGDIYLQQAEHSLEKEKEKMCVHATVYFQKVVDKYKDSNYYRKAEKGINIIKQICPEKVVPSPIDDLDPVEIEAKKILNQADYYRKNREFTKAMEHYNKLIRLYPNSQFLTNAYEGKGDIYKAEDNFREALANYEDAIENALDDERKVLLLDKYHSVFPKPKPIIIVKKSNNDDIEIIHTEAKRLRNSSKHYEAAELFKRLITMIQSNYDRSKFFRQASECYYNVYLQDKRMFDRSVNALKMLSDNYQGSTFSIHAYYYLVMIYVDKPNYDLVIDTVDRAINLYNKQQNEVAAELLEQMEEKKKWAEEIKRPQPLPNPNVVQPTPIQDPEYVVLTNRAEKLFNDNELDEAIIKVDKALSLNPDYVPAKLLKNSIRTSYVTKGNKLFEQNQYSNAIDEYKQALEIDSNFAEAYCNIGVSYIYLNNYEKAIDELNKSIQYKVDFKEAFLYLAYAYYRNGSKDQAYKEVKNALSIDPNYLDAQILKRALEKGY